MAWEEPYLSRITALRDKELDAIKKRWGERMTSY